MHYTRHTMRYAFSQITEMPEITAIARMQTVTDVHNCKSNNPYSCVCVCVCVCPFPQSPRVLNSLLEHIHHLQKNAIFTCQPQR